MNKENSVNPLCFKHAYVEEIVLCKPVVDFVPVRKIYGFQWRDVCSCFIELDVLLCSYIAFFLLDLGVEEKTGA